MGKPKQSLFETDEDSLLPETPIDGDDIEERLSEANINVTNNNVQNKNSNSNLNYNNSDENYKIEVQNFVQAKEKKISAGFIKIAIYIISWYTLSICLSIFNKWFFGKTHFNFPYSLFTTFVHTIVQFSWSFLTILLYPKYKSSSKLSVKNFFMNVFPCGAATGLDIGLSNTSLKSITLTFYTMIKSSTPVFVLLFAFLFSLEKPSVKLVGIIVIIVFGVFIMVMEETEFNFFGFMEVVIATVLGGLRWSMTQILLQKESLGLTNPIVTNYYLTPVMAFTVLIFSILHEGIGSILSSTFFSGILNTIRTLGYMCFGGSLAFLMIIAEYNIIMNTGVVTLSVAGIFKEIIVLVCSHFIFHDTFTTQAVIGLIISLIGIGLYNYHKIQLAKQKEYIAYENTILCDGEIDFFVLDDEDGNKLYELTNANTKLNKDIERSNVKSLNYAPRDKKQKVIFDQNTVDIQNNSNNVIASPSSSTTPIS